MDGRGLCRYAVLFRLPGLRFLDFQAVKQPERVEAKKRGKFTAVAKPKGAPSDGGATTEVDLSVNLVCVCLLCLTTHLRASQYPLTPLNGPPLAFVCKTVAPCPSISRLAPQFGRLPRPFPTIPMVRSQQGSMKRGHTLGSTRTTTSVVKVRGIASSRTTRYKTEMSFLDSLFMVIVGS